MVKQEKKEKSDENRSILAAKKSSHGFMYIGHLPHGFYENEIKSYFSQFGKIVRLRLAKSKRSGNYKGYGFVEFQNEQVAKIAAETMNNYLMFNKILKCHLIPKEKLNKHTFKNANKVFHAPLESVRRKKFNRIRSDKEVQVLKKKQTKRLQRKQKKLEELGIKVDFSKLNSLETNEPEAKPNKKQEKQPATEKNATINNKSEKKEDNRVKKNDAIKKKKKN